MQGKHGVTSKCDDGKQDLDENKEDILITLSEIWLTIHTLFCPMDLHPDKSAMLGTDK